MTTAEVGDTKAHGAVIATKPASIPLQAMVMSGLPNQMIPQQHCSRRARNRGQIGVHCNHGDAKVGRSQSRAGVESHPSEKQDERAGHDVDDVVSGEDTNLSAGTIFPKARTQE